MIEQAIGRSSRRLAKNITVLKTLAPVNLGVQGVGHVYKVILNLLSNAVKYTPQGGRVTLAAFDNLTRSVHVSVPIRDSVPPQDRERILRRSTALRLQTRG